MEGERPTLPQKDTGRIWTNWTNWTTSWCMNKKKIDQEKERKGKNGSIKKNSFLLIFLTSFHLIISTAMDTFKPTAQKQWRRKIATSSKNNDNNRSLADLTQDRLEEELKKQTKSGSWLQTEPSLLQRTAKFWEVFHLRVEVALLY